MVAPAMPDHITLTIKAYPDGHVELETKIHDTVALYGLLQLAMDAVRESRNKGSNILAPSGLRAGG